MKTSRETVVRTGCFVAAISLSVCAAQMAPAASRLSVGTARGFPGQTVEVPVSLRYGTNDPRNVVALQADVGYEAPATPGTAVGGSALQGHLLRTRETAAGTQRLLTYALNNAVMSNGVVATIPFTIAPGTRSNVRLTLDNVILSTADGTAVPATAVAGAILISSVYVRPQDGDVDGFFGGLQDGASYVVQATTDFIAWVNVATNAPVDSFLEFMDRDAHLHPYRFYRPMPLGGALNGIARLDGSQLTLRLLGVAGRPYVIQGSVDLQQWIDLSTNVAGSSAIVFTNTIDPAFPHRFFRLKSD